MHFQVNKDDYYDNIIRSLIEIVPEFISVYDSDDEVYPIVGEFGRFLIKNIDNEIIAAKCFNFINHALDIGKYETEDVIVLQIFQPIYNDELLVLKSKKYLSSKALKIFLEFERKYRENI